jgi:cytosine/adenosine deaminase-related metal-dependent hydrolase
MTVYRAAWVCPITCAPISSGWFSVSDGRIDAVGIPGQPPPSSPVCDLGAVVVLPGLVNAHTHLELSYLRGRVPPASSFIGWIKQLFLSRGGRRENPEDPKVVDAATQAAHEARSFGTAAVGDIGNSLASPRPIAEAGMHGLVFHELIGFNHRDGSIVEATRPERERAGSAAPDRVRVSIGPHAPYSVSPELFRAIRAEADRMDSGIMSVHLAESAAELDLLRDGSGPWPGLLTLIGAMPPGWAPPRLDPVAYLESLGMLDGRTLVVHGVQLTDEELRRLASIGCTLVTCPRSNQWVGAGVPPIERFYASGVRVAIGSDSLASVEDLNLFAELKTMRWLAPSIPARLILESATLTGATALGFGDSIGSIEAGKLAELIAVDVPEGELDVEEYLLSGIDERRIHWVPV